MRVESLGFRAYACFRLYVEQAQRGKSTAGDEDSLSLRERNASVHSVTCLIARTRGEGRGEGGSTRVGNERENRFHD